MEERILSDLELQAKVTNQVQGLFFLFDNEDISNQFTEFASRIIQEHSPQQLASILGDAIAFHLTERDNLESKVVDLEEQVESMKQSAIQMDTDIENMVDENTRLTIELEKSESILDMYKQKGITGDSPVVTGLLQTVQTLTAQIVELTKSNGETVKDITTDALTKIAEVSTKEVQYPEIPQAQVHIVQSPVQPIQQQVQQPIQQTQYQAPTPVYQQTQHQSPVIEEEVLDIKLPTMETSATTDDKEDESKGIEVGDTNKIVSAESTEPKVLSLEEIMAMNKKLSGG